MPRSWRSTTTHCSVSASASAASAAAPAAPSCAADSWKPRMTASEACKAVEQSIALQRVYCLAKPIVLRVARTLRERESLDVFGRMPRAPAAWHATKHHAAKTRPVPHLNSQLKEPVWLRAHLL